LSTKTTTPLLWPPLAARRFTPRAFLGVAAKIDAAEMVVAPLLGAPHPTGKLSAALMRAPASL
jgi:hypothetical protein